MAAKFPRHRSGTPPRPHLLLAGLAGEPESVRYFVLEVPTASTQAVFSLSGGTGDADLYVRHEALPQEFAYDCRPLRQGNDETCTFVAPNPGP